MRVTIDVKQAVVAAGDLAALPDVVGARIVSGINATAAAVRRRTVSYVAAEVNLSQQYVDDRVVIKSTATQEKPESTIASPVRGTLLSRFGAKQETAPDEWTASKYRAKFGSLLAQVRPAPGAPRMGWTTRTGSAKREIAPGQKAAGVAVAIRAGAGVKTIQHAFIMPLQQGNGKGVFTTPAGGGKPKVRYGPSVYQIARRRWEQESVSISDELTAAVDGEVSSAIADVMGAK